MLTELDEDSLRSCDIANSCQTSPFLPLHSRIGRDKFFMTMFNTSISVIAGSGAAPRRPDTPSSYTAHRKPY